MPSRAADWDGDMSTDSLAELETLELIDVDEDDDKDEEVVDETLVEDV